MCGTKSILLQKLVKFPYIASVPHDQPFNHIALKVEKICNKINFFFIKQNGWAISFRAKSGQNLQIETKLQIEFAIPVRPTRLQV